MKRNFFLFIFLLLGHFSGIKVQAQISHADSNFLNSIFKEGMYISYWNYPGTWYQHPEVSSVQNMYDQIDSSYLFHNDEFADCYRKITTSDVLERDTIVNHTIDSFENAYNYMLFGNKDPFVKLKFSLNNKNAYSYALLDSTSKPVYDNDHAFVIISGTGTNLLKVILDGIGYHDLNCYVRNLLKPYGDIFIMSMPNEDHRAIFFNKKKAASLPTIQPPYLLTYLNAANKSLGLNRLIETVAFIKHLKTKYKKVFVLGLSTGGKVALWASMLSEPDAALISSGYSILVDNDYNSQLINSMTYGNYLLVYDKDSTKARIGQLHTQLLFTQAQNDYPLTQYDLDNKITENFLSPLGNTSFFSNMVNHAFPPCPVIDSFLQRCFSKAKVFLSTDSSKCNKDSIVMNLHFFGRPPFSFQLYKDTTLLSNYYSPDTNFQISLFNEGNYLVKNIVDSAAVAGYTSDTFKYIKHTQPFANVSEKEFVCDSNKTKILFDFGGKSPFLVNFTRNNIPDSLQLSHIQDSTLLQGGNYVFLSVRDAHNCVNPLMNSLNLDSNNLNMTISNVQYNCLSDKNAVGLNSTGVLPLTLSFYDSTISSFRYEVLNGFSQTLYLDSGAYRFISITDSNNCVKLIDSSILISSEPLSFAHDSMQYFCNDNFAVLPVHLKGKASWIIQLEHGGVTADLLKIDPHDTIHIPQGISTIRAISDANNCVTKISDSVIVNPYRKLNVVVFSGQFDCIQKHTPLQLHIDGNFPVQVYGMKASLPFETAVFSSPAAFTAHEGYFSIDSVADKTDCRLRDIYQATFTSDTVITEGIYQDKMKLVTSNTSFSGYYWYLNDKLIRETAEPFIEIEKNGVYEVGFFTQNNCFLKTKKLTVDMGKMTVYPNPFEERIYVLVNLDPGEKINYALKDFSGRQLLQSSLNDGLNQIDIPLMSRGIYILEFETNRKNISYPSQKVYKN